jgi:hypothetical protein
MSDREVIDVKTIHYMGGTKIDQRALMLRCREIAERIADWMLDKPHDVLVVEGFVTFQNSNRSNPYSFQTPYLCGVIGERFGDSENIVWQLSSEVLNPRRHGNCAFVKDKVKSGHSIISGDGRCTNDHLRSALAHGVYYYMNSAKEDICVKGKPKGNGLQGKADTCESSADTSR